jgi:hypothetical protein
MPSEGRKETGVNWQTDQVTWNLAITQPMLQIQDPAPQYGGGLLNVACWQRRIRATDAFPYAGVRASPDEIISAFRWRQYLPAVAMVVVWGGMSRTASRVYGDHDLTVLHESLAAAAQSIHATASVADAWQILTEQCGWTPVMKSKILHFLCRALGFDVDPPVPIDNAVVIQRIWPAFVAGIPLHARPQRWDGGTFADYNRYITAIRAWAEVLGWTTTEVECTLYAQFSGANM